MLLSFSLVEIFFARLLRPPRLLYFTLSAIELSENGLEVRSLYMGVELFNS